MLQFFLGTQVKPARLTHLTSQSSTSDLSEYTFSSVNFGAEAADRDIFVLIHTRRAGAHEVTGVTIGGAASEIVEAGESTNGTTALYRASVPTGTSGTIVVTLSATALRCAIDVFRGINIASAVTQTREATTSTLSTTLDIPAGGVALAGGQGFESSSPTFTWTGLTERSDATIEGNSMSYTSASGEFATEQTALAITATPTAALNAPTWVAASFGPASSSSASTLAATTADTTASLTLDANDPGASAATIAATAADATASFALTFVGAPSAATIAATTAATTASLTLDANAPGDSAATLAATTGATTAALVLDAETPPASAITLAATADATTASLALDANAPTPAVVTITAATAAATAALVLDYTPPAGSISFEVSATTADTTAAITLAYLARTDLREIIYDRTRADAAITALVGTRIYPEWLPQDATLPALTITVVSNIRGRLLSQTGQDGTARARVQFDCWGTDPVQTAALTAAVADLWNGWRGVPAEGTLVYSSRQVDESDRAEPPRDGSDDWTQRISADYSIHYRIAPPDR